MRGVKAYLGGLMSEPILTLCPANLFKHVDCLDQTVLECFTYVMPQSYGHGGNGTMVDHYALMIGGGRAMNYEKIVYGLSAEDDPTRFVQFAKDNKAAGVFSWRLDTDSMPRKQPEGQQEGPDQLPTFAVAKKMWQLMRG
jgi:hypothetical protein